MRPTMAFSYVRCSTVAQAEFGTTEERQLSNARAYAAKNGWELDDSLRARASGHSGKHLEGALGTFLKAISARTVVAGDVLIIEAIDRLSRQESQISYDLVREITRAGVSIHTLEDGHIYSSDTIKATPYLLQFLLGKIQQAHEYSERLSFRVKSGKGINRAAKLQAGRPVTRMCPAWLQVVGGKYVEIAERVEVVQWIFAQLAAGVGRERIAKTLNATRTPTFSREGQGLASSKIGKGWHPSYISKLKANRAVVGDFIPSSKGVGSSGRTIKDLANVVVGHYGKPIVDRNIFNALQTKQPAGRRGATFSNLLTGITFCLSCGGKMRFKDGGERWPHALNRRKQERSGRYLICDSAFCGIGCGNKGHMPYPIVEGAVLNLVNVLARADEFSDYVRPVKTFDAEIAELQAKIEADTLKVDKALRRFDPDCDDLIIKRIRKMAAGIEAMNATVVTMRMKSQAQKSTGLEFADELGRLKQLRVSSRAENDPATKFAMRAEMAQLIRKHVDYCVINADGKAVTIWLGGGLLLSIISGDTVLTMIVNDKRCLILSDIGIIMKEIETPEAIRIQHLDIIASSDGIDTSRNRFLLSSGVSKS